MGRAGKRQRKSDTEGGSLAAELGSPASWPRFDTAPPHAEQGKQDQESDTLMMQVPDAPLFYAMAKEHVEDPNLWDDCVQEAAIRVWQLQRRGGDHSQAYYHQAARRRIKEVATRQTWLGHSGRHGKPIDPLRMAHDSLDAIHEARSAHEA